jgi:pimeloyl-ACP methyl ester carboxylesterase
MVNIALGNTDILACTAGDANGDVTITVDEILAAVNNALNGCPATSSVVVGLSPAAVMMPSGGQQSFRATVIGTTDTAVTWSVAEGSSGGSVDAQGSYTAPVEPGVYHVLATSHADATKTAQATVMVSILPPEPAFAPQPIVPPSPDTETNTGTVAAGTTGSVGLADGTRVDVPPMPGPVTVSVTRSAENVDAVRVFGQEPTGSPRTVIYTGDAAALDFVPTITIPASEAGTITALNVARIGPLVVNGSLQDDTVTFLPAARDEHGNIVVRDVFLRGAARLAAAAPTGGLGAAADAGTSVRTIYNLSTYQAQLNWSIAPQLVRMVPDASMPEKRRPLSSLSATERDAVLRKPIQNVIVLVHGHNEAEKLGFEAKQIPAIWGYEYKRNVWTFIYQWFLDATAGYDPYAGCTAFYEFIYPSYRPVFEGQGALGAALASALGADEKLKKQAAKYNLFFVAHSMGGLVSRAAINQLPFAVAPNFEKLITWGTPHHGSPVMTFRYLLTSGYNLYVPGMCLTGNGVPLEIFNEMAIYNSAVQGQAVDSPGWRDNRWDNFKPLNLAGIGWSRAPWQIGDDVRWDPARNEDIYSAALLHFNQNDRFYLSDKYVAFDGLTKQLAPIDLTSCSAMWSFYKAAPIAKGAGINRWTYNSPETLNAYPNKPEVKQSDGAVSVDSMVGLGVFASYNTYPLDDVDHEQYFGAPHDGNITPENKDKADDTAIRTLSTLNLKNAPNKQCDCPTLAITDAHQSPPDVTITGKVTWPGDASPKARIASVALVRLEAAGRVVVPASSPSVQPDGSISGTFPASAFAGLALAPLFTAVLADGGELSVPAPVIQTGTATDTFKGLAGSIDGSMVTPPFPAFTVDVGVEAEQVELFTGEPTTGPWEFEWPAWAVGSSSNSVTFNVWFRIRNFGAANWFPAQFCSSLRCHTYELVRFLKGVAYAWDPATRVEGGANLQINGLTLPHEGGIGPGHDVTLEVWYRIRETRWWINDPTDISTYDQDNHLIFQTTFWSK